MGVSVAIYSAISCIGVLGFKISSSYRSAIKLCELDNFGDIKNFMRFKIMRLYVRKILLTINFAQLKFVRNLIMPSGSDSHK